MHFDNPEKGEALDGAFEIMAERIAQVAEAVAWIDHVVEQLPEHDQNQNVQQDYTLAA